MKKTVCVDLDGVLADFSGGWQGIDVIGDPIPGAVEFVKPLSELADVLIFTTRCSVDIQKLAPHLLRRPVQEWLDRNGFVYADIWTGRGKPIASAYIDDRAVHCAPQEKTKDGAIGTRAYQSSYAVTRYLVLGEERFGA